MATFSDHFSSTASASSVEVGYRPGPKQNFSTETIRAEFLLPTTAGGAPITDDDTIMFTLHTSDRLHSINLSADALIAATALNIDVGTHLAGDNHDGGEVDEDFFSSTVDLDSTGPVRADSMFESGTVQPSESGDYVWEILNLASDTDTYYDVVIHWNLVTAITVGGKVVLEAEVSRPG